MSYQKHNFTAGETILAAPFNEMENQIVANETAIQGKASSGDLATLAGQIANATAQRMAVNTALKQFMTDMKTLLGELAYTKENHSGAVVFADAGAVISAIDGSGEVLATYTIIKSLTKCTISNSATTAVQNSAYTATVTVDAGAAMSAVMISMGGVDITATAWNALTGTITIPSVTGNLIIACTAVEDSQGGETPELVETVLYSNKAADGTKWSQNNIPVSFADGDYFEASIVCTNVDDSGSGTAVISFGETGRIGYGSNCNSVTVFWRSNKALCRYKTAGGSNTEATKDEWVTVSNKQFTVSLDKDGFKVNGALAISASLMGQMMILQEFAVGSTSSSNTDAFYPYIKVFNAPSAENE